MPQKKSVITRFAPSPTGFLHIGGARTALFNFLYARHHGGKYLVRIEDTDTSRSTPEAMRAILQGLQWLGLEGDGEPVYQSQNRQRHRQVAEALLASGHAYYCTCTAEDVAARRGTSKEQGYDRHCRKNPPDPAKSGAIRIKAPLADDGEAEASHIRDLVQGDIDIPAGVLDDFVILRQDGTPTYMLSVVVDDHDMQISHVIRGDDHLMNGFRQKIVYDACGWDCPEFAHIPLIHGMDGKKLSKRHGALAVSYYHQQGYLPQAICNHILRLGWGHGDIEIIDSEHAIALFDIGDVGRAAARFDFDKLASINAHYLHALDDEELLPLLHDFIDDFDDKKKKAVKPALAILKMRAKTLQELAESAEFCWQSPIYSKADLAEVKGGFEADIWTCLGDIKQALALSGGGDWHKDNIKAILDSGLGEHGLKAKQIMPLLRLALTGSPHSAGGVTDIMVILGEQQSLLRLAKFLDYYQQ